MTTEPKKIEIFLAVNQAGDFYVTGDSADDAVGGLQGDYTCEAVRVVAINVTIDLPVAEVVNVDVAIPAETKAPAQVTVS